MKKRFSEGFLLKSCFGAGFRERPGGKSAEKSAKIETVFKHLNKYLNELKLHFDLSDDDILSLISRTYSSKKPENPFLKYLNMLKYWN